MNPLTRAKMTQGISLARVKMQTNECSCRNRISKRQMVIFAALKAGEFLHANRER